MDLPLSTGGVNFQFQASGVPANLKVRKANLTGGAAASTFTLTGGMGSPQIVLVTTNVADIDVLGPIIFWVEDGTNVIQGSITGNVQKAPRYDLGFEPANLLITLGMASANLDTQLAGILADVTPVAIRGAIGLAAANLDAQLAAAGVALTAAQVRSAVGLAAANLDAQLAAQPALLLDQANGVEASLTVRQAMRAIAAVLVGQAAIGAGHSIFKAAANPGTTRVDGTTPGGGVRSAVALTL
jgi:hypothetical protein